MYPRAFKLNENVLKRVLLAVLLPYATVVRSAVRPVVDGNGAMERRADEVLQKQKRLVKPNLPHVSKQNNLGGTVWF